MITIREEERALSTTADLKQLVGFVVDELELQGDVAIVFSDELRGRELNKKYRKIDRATNVLSFPSEDPSVAGDIVITVPVVKREAKDRAINPTEHEQRLIIHGLLHLAGFLHKTDDEATIMESREEELYSLYTS